MNSEKAYYLECIEKEFAARIDKNSRYSLRAFSKAVGIAPGALSQILSGKRFFTERLALRFFSVLELSPSQQNKFLRSLAEKRKSSGLSRPSVELRRALNRPEANTPSPTAVESQHLYHSHFKIISDWYHFAILEMSETAEFKPDARWIAGQLQISPAQASLALSRLREMGMLKEVEHTLRKSASRFSTPDKTKSSPWHRKRQRQILSKAMTSLENDPIEIRNHSSLTFSIDPKLIPQARIAIQKFTWEMSNLLSTSNSQRVYELAIQLFPLQHAPEVKS